MVLVFTVSFRMVRLRNRLLCGRNEEQLDLTILGEAEPSRGVLGTWGRLKGEIVRFELWVHAKWPG